MLTILIDWHVGGEWGLVMGFCWWYGRAGFWWSVGIDWWCLRVKLALVNGVIDQNIFIGRGHQSRDI